MKTETRGKIIGREAEIAKISDALNSDASEFIAIYGRRRIGKTFLIKEMFAQQFCFSFTGIEENNTRQQLAEFHRSLLRQGLSKCAKPQNWFDAFDMLRSLLESKTGNPKFNHKKIVFLDELPWMDAKGSNFVQALGHFWNDWAAWTGDVLLIICSSATSWMLKKVFSNHGGLYNRVTHQIYLGPFSLNECEKYCKARRFNWTRNLITEAYMILGGVPYYWTMLDPHKSLSSNIDELFFSHRAQMGIEYNALFKSLFNNSEKHEAIVGALIQKKSGMTAKELSDKTGIGMSASFSNILGDLKASGFIHEIPQPTKRERGAIYQIADNFILFYHNFLHKKKCQSNFWTSHHGTGIVNSWRGLAFERVCAQHINQIQKALGIGGVYCEYFAWAAKENESFPAMQCDMIIDRADNMVNICEMKYTDGPYAITPAYLSELNLRRSRYQQEIAPKKGVQLTMVVSSGLVRNPQSMEINSVITLDDLFEP